MADLMHSPEQFHPLAQAILDAIPRKELDVPYCSQSPLQILDLYLPENAPMPYPLIIHIHGGAFANGNQREDNVVPMLRGLERGYAVASIQYRRSREALFPAQVWDTKAAVRFLRSNAARWNLDPERFAVWGPSSGGWLSAMTALTPDNPAFTDPGQGNAGVSETVQAVIDWCGPCGGFLEMDQAFRRSGLGVSDHDQADSPESCFLGHQITEVPELCRMACPCTYVSPGMPPVCIVHGGSDQVVPVEQSVTFARAIQDAAGDCRVELHVVEGKLHHGDPWYHEPWVAELCFDFLDKHLK